MKILETKSNSVLSILIRWAFNSKGSHIIFAFDNNKWVLHSNLLGVNIRWYKNFMKTQTIVDSMDYSELTLEQEEEIFQNLLDKTSESEYDYAGFLYFAIHAVLFKLFKKPMPKTNAWGKSQMFLCTEMTKQLPPWLVKIPDNIDLGITTPDELMRILREVYL